MSNYCFRSLWLVWDWMSIVFKCGGDGTIKWNDDCSTAGEPIGRGGQFWY